ncbi:MAG: 50S ribosomal protein L29 [Desulfobacteraceae bacterium]|nr:50S ribosomal protein L29 [Desulfobacteraceae bacterium]
MKASEIRDMSQEEQFRRLSELKETLFTLRFQSESGQLENSAKLKQTRRDIARLKTIIIEQNK